MKNPQKMFGMIVLATKSRATQFQFQKSIKIVENKTIFSSLRILGDRWH